MENFPTLFDSLLNFIIHISYQPPTSGCSLMDDFDAPPNCFSAENENYQ